MSDSAEPETPLQGENIRKRTFESGQDQDPKKQSSIAKKPTARKLEFERTEEEALKKEDVVAKKPTARKLEFEPTEEEALKEQEDALPLACSICGQPFLDPVVTKCNHYFCKHCALKHHEKNKNCFVCDQPTLGVFNTAVEIKKKIAKVREKAQAMVKEVSAMVAEAAVIVKNADAMSAESAEIVEEIETMLGILETYGAKSAEDPSSWDSVVRMVENVEDVAANAREMAEKAAEMMQVAKTTTETARAAMAKALVVMKNVRWNV